MILEITLFLILILLIIVKRAQRKSTELPGPFYWPFIGNLPQIWFINWKRVWLSLDYYAQFYGKIYGMYFGPRYVVVISDPDLASELMKRNEWCGRVMDPYVRQRALNGVVLGINVASGEMWKTHRKFAMQYLKEFGFGKSGMETSMMLEVNKVKRVLWGATILPQFTFEYVFEPAILSVMWDIVAGKRFALDDVKILNCIRAVKTIVRERALGQGLAWSFVELGYKLRKLSGVSKQLGSLQMLQQDIAQTVLDHKQTRIPGEPRDYMDRFLDEIDHDPENPYFFDRQLSESCLDLLIASSDPSANVLQYVFLYAIMYPKIQEKVQEELDRVVGKRGVVTLADRERLPYVRAFLWESYRYGSVLPIIVPHAATDDTSYDGYHIPNGTLAFINAHGINKSKSYWKDPDAFRPERFINEKGEINLEHTKHVIIFGAGKRKCVGEGFANAAIFLMTCNILKQFSFANVPGQVLDHANLDVGVDCRPAPFYFKVSNRI